MSARDLLPLALAGEGRGEGGALRNPQWLPARAAPSPQPSPASGRGRGRGSFEHDVIEGLSRPQKSIPCLWLYDHRGSEIFEEITGVPEYYPTRHEIDILSYAMPQVAAAVGPAAVVVEFGSGSSRKTPLVLRGLDTPRAYVPIDVSEQFLLESVEPLQHLFPQVRMRPVADDFTRIGALPPLLPPGPRLGFFPGSTIGNFTPGGAAELLARFARVLGPRSWLLVGADATQDAARLVPAYDDRAGVTAAFNRNLLVRANRELGADFDLRGFGHEARWNAVLHRVEMHLVSRKAQTVSVSGRRFDFRDGETIHTENSYKHGVLRFQALARRAGWKTHRLWNARDSGFTVYLFEHP
jgi:L-histidine N-alpha-methyltransferase